MSVVWSDKLYDVGQTQFANLQKNLREVWLRLHSRDKVAEKVDEGHVH